MQSAVCILATVSEQLNKQKMGYLGWLSSLAVQSLPATANLLVSERDRKTLPPCFRHSLRLSCLSGRFNVCVCLFTSLCGCVDMCVMGLEGQHLMFSLILICGIQLLIGSSNGINDLNRSPAGLWWNISSEVTWPSVQSWKESDLSHMQPSGFKEA